MGDSYIKKQKILAISGVKNSGKTTFLEKLIPVLKEKGLKIVVIKHDGHDFDADVPGTDSFRFGKAGACGVAVFSDKKYMVVKKTEESSVELLMAFFPDADVIFLEGFKNTAYPKIELVRKKISKKSVCAKKNLLALVTDTDLKISGIPTYCFEDIDKVAALVLALDTLNLQ